MMSECEKMVAVKEESLTLSEFLDWLSEQRMTICKTTSSNFNPYFPISLSNEKLLAKFFDIDLDKAEQEKQEILKQLRK